MENRIKIAILSLIIISGLGSIPVVYAEHNPIHTLYQTVIGILNTLNGHTQRILSLELQVQELNNKTSITVATTNSSSISTLSVGGGGQQHPDCTYFNVGTENATDMRILGWCPQSGETWYFIEDSRAETNNVLVIFNIQNVNADVEGVSNCRVASTGLHVYPTIEKTGFVLACETGLTITHTLVYSVFT